MKCIRVLSAFTAILIAVAGFAVFAACATSLSQTLDNSSGATAADSGVATAGSGGESVEPDPYAIDFDDLGWTAEPENKDKTVEEVPFVYKGMALTGLRGLAERKGLELGVALSFKNLSNTRYATIASQEFNVFTPENEMKWETIHGTRETYDWFFADEFLKFAQQHSMKVRGHTLVWHNQLPRWVSQTAKTKADILSIVSDHVKTIVSHYKGRIYKWDVVNEVVDDSSGMRSSIFYDLSGTDFIELAFREAHAADPSALLYINDYSVEDINSKSDRLYALVKSLLSKGVPIHGVGMQSHWDLAQLPPIDSVRANIQRFLDLGLRVDVTELDVRMDGSADLAKFKAQATAYENLFKLILELPKTDTIVIWGLDDGHSWVRSWRPAYGFATMLDSNYGAKPAYEAVYRVLAN